MKQHKRATPLQPVSLYVFDSIKVRRNVKVVQIAQPLNAVFTQHLQVQAQINPVYPKIKQIFEPASSIKMLKPKSYPECSPNLDYFSTIFMWFGGRLLIGG